MKIAARMGLIALVIGTATAVAATGRVTLSLVARGTLVWSFVPLLQFFTGLLLVRGANIGPASALEGYFKTHRAWSLWLLACAATLLLIPNPGGAVQYLAATFLIPMVLTVRMLGAFCRGDLGFSPAVARRRVMLHQAVTVAVGLVYGNYAGALIDRMVDGMGS